MTGERGFTITEVLIAIIILSVGLLGLASSAALVTRMIAQGQRYTEATTLANHRFEILRSKTCPAMVNGDSTAGAFKVAWSVTPMTAGRANQVAVTVTSPTGTGTRSDVFYTVMPC